MKAEAFTGSNKFLKAPDDWDEEAFGKCPDLPVYIGQGFATTVWRPSPEEAALLMGGGVVVLTLATTEVPPIMMRVCHTRTADEGMAEA